jgi:hypothetical protein
MFVLRSAARSTLIAGTALALVLAAPALAWAAPAPGEDGTIPVDTTILNGDKSGDGDSPLIQLGNTDGDPSPQPDVPSGQLGTPYPVNPYIEGDDVEHSHPSPEAGARVERNGEIHQSADWRPPADSNDVTGKLPFAGPAFNPVLPGDLGVVRNHAYGDEVPRTHTAADHQQYTETTPNDPDWRSGATDVVLPGFGRMFTVHFVCPGMNRYQKPTGDYTAGTTLDPNGRELVLSWGFGDRLVDSSWIYSHYLLYSTSNGDGYDPQAGPFFDKPYQGHAGHGGDAGTVHDHGSS